MLPYTNPQGYKQLRTWQQANEILELTEEFIKTLPAKEPARSHMDRSARSVVRNIEEGFSRTTTKEYVAFLGFSKGSLEELLRDFEHCIAKGDKGIQRVDKAFVIASSSPSVIARNEAISESEADKGIGNQLLAQKGFYLCKGEGKMLYNQIIALEKKMVTEKTLSGADMARRVLNNQAKEHREANKWLQELTEKLRVEERVSKGGKGSPEAKEYKQDDI